MQSYMTGVKAKGSDQLFQASDYHCHDWPAGCSNHHIRNYSVLVRCAPKDAIADYSLKLICERSKCFNKAEQPDGRYRFLRM